MSFDPIAANRAFAEKFSFPYRLLSDESHAIGAAYGAEDDKKSQYARRIAYLIGPDGVIRHVWPKANPGAFTDEALGKL